MYSFDKISFLRNNKRWFPIMGEIHFSRYPKNFWHESLIKMKAGGVDIASTYVFWIHHEEIEGQYDFSENRDLNYFVKTCKECRIKLWLRIGPWAHGEVRNGGFPDWVFKKDFEPRTNDERYFSLVEKWYKIIIIHFDIRIFRNTINIHDTSFGKRKILIPDDEAWILIAFLKIRIST